jgi:hypothetical protein
MNDRFAGLEAAVQLSRPWPQWGKGRRKARSSALRQVADIGVSRISQQNYSVEAIGLF